MTEMLTPAEWMETEAYQGWRILDFDGWNTKEYVRKIEWRTPIFADEMELRFSKCTVEQIIPTIGGEQNEENKKD